MILINARARVHGRERTCAKPLPRVRHGRHEHLQLGRDLHVERHGRLGALPDEMDVIGIDISVAQPVLAALVVPTARRGGGWKAERSVSR